MRTFSNKIWGEILSVAFTSFVSTLCYIIFLGSVQVIYVSIFTFFLALNFSLLWSMLMSCGVMYESLFNRIMLKILKRYKDERWNTCWNASYSALTTNYVDLGHWEFAICAAAQELPDNLWYSKVYYRVHKSPSLVHILSEVDPVHTTPSCLRSILTWSKHLRLILPTGLLSSDFSTNHQYAFVFFSIHATCHCHFIIFDLITAIMFSV
jgi:hypothetical protein